MGCGASSPSVQTVTVAGLTPERGGVAVVPPRVGSGSFPEPEAALEPGGLERLQGGEQQPEREPRPQPQLKAELSPQPQPEAEIPPQIDHEPDVEQNVPDAAYQGSFPVDDCPEVMPDLQKHHTLVAKILRDEPLIYHKYKRATSGMGVTFARCIKTGMDHRGVPQITQMGLVSGDADCYKSFSDLFNPVIEQRHFGWKPPQTHVSDLSTDGVLDRPVFRGGTANRYVRLARVRSARSIAGFRFPPACTAMERREVERIAAGAMLSALGSDDALAGEYFPLVGSGSYAAKPRGKVAPTARTKCYGPTRCHLSISIFHGSYDRRTHPRCARVVQFVVVMVSRHGHS